jgi:hypothetical protein
MDAFTQITYAVWLFENTGSKKHLFAEVLGKDPDDRYEQAYLADKVQRYGNDFGNFWCWLDRDAQRKFIEMANAKYNR